MSLKNFVGSATMALTPVLIGAAGYWLWSAHYWSALVAIVGVVLCMELRVRMGWRLPRSRTFVLHILMGVALLVCLMLLAWKPMPQWMPVFAGILFATVALGGGAKLVEQYATLE